MSTSVEQEVTNQVVDMGLLAQTAEPAKEVLGVERIAVVADRGYFKIEDIEACEKAGIDPYVPRPQRGPSVRAGLFRKDEFRYDPTSDSFLCPAGQRPHGCRSSRRAVTVVSGHAPRLGRVCRVSGCSRSPWRRVAHRPGFTDTTQPRYNGSEAEIVEMARSTSSGSDTRRASRRRAC
jgi:hypothetical protein